MEGRRIGSLEVSLAGLGTNNFGRRLDAARSAAVVHAALDAGMTFIDTADVYGGGRAEEYLGRALKGRRDQAVVASKFGYHPPPRGPQRQWVPEALEDSLRRLGTDYLDVYYYHQPDPAVPIEETLGLMDGFVTQGKVREIACSNFHADLLDEATGAAHRLGTRPFAAVQNEYSLLEREPEGRVLSAARIHGMAFVPYFPLASGLLSGKYRRGRPAPPGRLGGDGTKHAEEVIAAERLEVVERLARYAEERDHTLLELAMGWLLAHPPVVSVIAGATSPEQVRANAAAAEAWRLNDDELREIDGLTRLAEAA